MKKHTSSATVFGLAFILVYLCLSYFVPAWRLKLEADAMTYFEESMKHMFVIKAAISFAAGALMTWIYLRRGGKR